MALAWHQHGRWQAQWVRGSITSAPVVSLFHLAITLPKKRTLTFRVSGDERFEWYVDGVCHARGPERGDGSMWHYHTVTVTLTHTSSSTAKLAAATEPWRYSVPSRSGPFRS